MSINLYGYSTQRVSGLISGMDTDTIIENMMATDQSKLDKLFQQKEKAQWKYDAYTELNTSVSSLRNTYLSVLGDKSLMKSATYNAYQVAMADNSAVTVTATSSALASSFKILSTTKAAAASKTQQADTQQTELLGQSGQFLQASAQGTLALEEGQTISESTTIEELADQFGLAEGETLSFAINGETFSFERTDTLGDIAQAVNDSETADVSMTFDYEAGTVSLASNIIGADTKLQLSDTSSTTGTIFASESGFGVSNAEVEKKSVVSDLSSVTFKQMADLAGLEMEGDTFTINGTAFSGLESQSVQSVMDQVNSTLTDITMSYDEDNGTFSIRNNADSTTPQAAIQVSGSLFGEESVFGVEEGTYDDLGSVERSDTIAEAARKMGNTVDDEITVTVNGKEFTFDTQSATLSDMMYTIGKDSDAQAVFSYSEMMDSFQISNTDTGSDSTLSFSGFAIFGLADETGIQGTDAKMVVESDGVTKEITQASNTFTLDGLTFEITDTEDFGDDGLSVSVERDYQTTIDAIKSFVDSYNEVVGALTTQYYETSYSTTYPPLTEDERSAMTETEAAKWDEKAMSGILRNDATIGSLINGLRSTLFAQVGETGMSAYDLGITTVSWSSDTWKTEQGKLTLDEDKLLAALKENPNAVQEVFTKISTTDSGATDTSTSTENGVTTASSGLLLRMNSLFSSFNTAMRSQNIVNTENSITSYTEKMSDLIEKMAEKEESYYAKYSAMETALSELQSQQDWLTAQLGSST